MIAIEVDDHSVIAALRHLRDKAGNQGMRPALVTIGDILVETTKQRFTTSTAPDGSAWQPNAESTLLTIMRRAAGKGGMRTKQGNTRAKAVGALAGKRPLVASGRLARSIRYQLIPGGVAVGTDRTWGNGDTIGAAVHQLGSKNGRIPARPFLGVSDSDRRVILDIIARHLAG